MANCPNCGAPTNTHDSFCGTCGQTLTQPPPRVEQPVELPPVQQPTPAPPAQQQPVQQAAPAKKVPVGLIIGLIAAAIIVLISCSVGGFFAWRAISTGTGDQPPVVTTPPETSTESPVSTGHATPDAAIESELPDGWVFGLMNDEGDRREYILGPPNSEYTDVMVVQRQPDGSWAVVDTYPLDLGELGGHSEAQATESEAAYVVDEFLNAVKEDRADDAHALTVPPFSQDPASAQYSNGNLHSIEILSATLQGDGSTVHVRTLEAWYDSTEEWIYVCVPTSDGYRIAELLFP